MGTIYDGRWNERAEDWDEANYAELSRIAGACGLSGQEKADWIEAQNPHRRPKRPAKSEPTLFGEPALDNPHGAEVRSLGGVPAPAVR
jgi:hypothetical protein